MSSTIGVVLISYDVNKSHTDVKDAMKAKGYSQGWCYDKEPSHDLPNTTLWHENKSTDQAIADIKSVCASLRVVLEKAVAVKATDFVGI